MNATTTLLDDLAGAALERDILVAVLVCTISGIVLHESDVMQPSRAEIDGEKS